MTAPTPAAAVEAGAEVAVALPWLPLVAYGIGLVLGAWIGYQAAKARGCGCAETVAHDGHVGPAVDVDEQSGQ